MRQLGRSLSVLVALGATASLALAEPPRSASAKARDVARALRDEGLAPEAAAAEWEKAGVTPEEALLAVQGVPLLERPKGDHEIALTDDLGGETTAKVLLPKDGPDKEGKFRVLILLHGLGGDARQAVKGSAGLVPPHTIVVAPTALRSPDGLVFEDMRAAAAAKLPVTKVFKSWFSYRETSFPLLALDHVARRFPLDRDRVVLAGYSMGGFCTWNLGLRFHDRFAGLAPLAGGPSREEFMQARDPLSRALLDNAAMVPVYFIHGAKDEVVPVTFDRWTAEDLKARGIEHTYVEVPDGKHVLREFMDPDHPTKKALREWVGARARDPHPAKVVHRAIGAYHAAAYWVRVDAYEGNAAKVEARVVAKDRVEVTTQGVRRLTVFLDPTLVDAGKPVTLVVDGQTLHEGVAAPSLLAVASSYARARDAGLAYAQAITVDVAPRDVQQLGGFLDDLLRGGRGRRF